MRTRSFVVKCLVFLVIVAVGASVGVFAFASAKQLLNQSLAPAPQYPQNASGETFGSLLYATSSETAPDLVKAIGVDGTEGYVRASDLIGELPDTVEEALAQEAKLADMTDGWTIPLYKEDGKTVIGEYEISPGIVSEVTVNDR